MGEEGGGWAKEEGSERGWEKKEGGSESLREGGGVGGASEAEGGHMSKAKTLRGGSWEQTVKRRVERGMGSPGMATGSPGIRCTVYSVNVVYPVK